MKDYNIVWTTDGKTLFEDGTITLVLSSGKTLSVKMASQITAKKGDFRKLPPEGELVSVSYSPFRIEGNKMSYDWTGTVSRRSKQ